MLLADQDRGLWRRDEVDEALTLLADPVLAGPLDVAAASYALQARIATEHALAPSAAATRWDRVVEGYDQLLDIDPSPGARVARAVAVAERDGPAAGLDALSGVRLPGHRAEAVAAELLTRLGRRDEAIAAYDRAIALCRNEVERVHLVEQRAAAQGSQA